MRIDRLRKSCIVVFAVAICVMGLSVTADQEVVSRAPAKSPEKADEAGSEAELTVKEARRLSRVLHVAMHVSLQHVHDQFYREDEGLRLPAAVLTDVFSEVEEAERIRLRWLAVEGVAMNSDHVAKTDFEKAAVKALKAGTADYEQSTDGIYRRAAPITLSNHCLKCHVPDRKSTEDRTAGLIISMPVSD